MMSHTLAPMPRHPVLDTGVGLASRAQRSLTPDQVRGDGIEGRGVPSTDPTLSTAAQGFEQIFLRQMIGAMRAGSLGDPLFGSSGEDQFRELFDARMAESLAAQGGGIGIGQLLLNQLERGRAL